LSSARYFKLFNSNYQVNSVTSRKCCDKIKYMSKFCQ